MEFLGLILIAVAIYLYFIPAIYASRKNRRDTMPILVLNVLLGWTLVGWVVALVWAARDDSPASVVVQSPTALDGDTRTCPHCAETVKAAAKVCKHCHGVLTPSVAASTPPVAQSTPGLFSEDYKETMDRYGITFSREKFWFGQYAYDNLDDAVNYANTTKVATGA